MTYLVFMFKLWLKMNMIYFHRMLCSYLYVAQLREEWFNFAFRFLIISLATQREGQEDNGRKQETGDTTDT